MPEGSAVFKPLHFGPDRLGGPTYSVYPEAEGLQLPIVIGYPGDLGDGNSTAVVPVVLTDWCANVTVHGPTDQETSRVSVSIGRIDASTIYLGENHKFPNGPTYTASVSYDTQVTVGKGGETTYDVSYVDFTGNDSAGASSISLLPTELFTSDSKAQFYAGFKPTTGGGISNPYGTGTLSGAGDVIIWALRRSGGDLAVDFEELEKLRPVLNDYRIDTFINDATITALKWLRSVVLPILPVVETTTGKGWSLAYIDWCASEADALGTLVADRDVFRASSARVING